MMIASDEEAILGLCLHDQENFHEALRSGLRSAHFHNASLRGLFSTLIDLNAEGASLGIPDVLTRSGANSALLAGLLEKCPLGQNVGHYIRNVKAMAWVRLSTAKLGEAARHLLNFNDPGNVEGQKARVAELMASLLGESEVEPILEPPELAQKGLLELEERIKLSLAGQKAPGYPTGMAKLDRYIYGFKPQRLYIVAARTGVGKTTIAVNFAWAVAQTANVLFFTNEMDQVEILEKVVSLSCGIEQSRLERGDLSDEQMDMLAETYRRVHHSKLRICDSTRMYAERLFSEIRRMHRKGKADMVIVDYLQQYRFEAQAGDRFRKSRHLEIAEITMQLKMLAKELKIPIICLAQLNRNATKSEEPTLADIKDSGSIEQDSDVILLIYRVPIVDAQTKQKTGDDLWLKIAKARKGEEGIFRLRADMSRNLITQA